MKRHAREDSLAKAETVQIDTPPVPRQPSESQSQQLPIFNVKVKYGSGEPHLYSAPVVRETRTFYLIEGQNREGFGWRNRVPKDSAHLTPAAAWNAYLERQRREVAMTFNKLSVDRQRLVLAERALAALVGSGSNVKHGH